MKNQTAELSGRSIGINDTEEPKPGYRNFIESVGIFDLTGVLELEEGPRQNLKIFATTNLMIGRVRGLIPTLSSQAPFGAYQLPSIDLNDLINQKRETVEKIHPLNLKGKNIALAISAATSPPKNGSKIIAAVR